MSSRERLDEIIENEVSKIKQEDFDRAQGKVRPVDCSVIVHRSLNGKQNRERIYSAMGPAFMNQWDASPHLRFPLINNVPISRVEVKRDSDLFMRLTSDAQTRPYQYTGHISCIISMVHIGQRKLLINEILFLNLHGSKSNVVVYIGAAGGSHTVALAEMFPNHNFFLYDPAPFSRPILDYMRKNPRRVKIYNELFPPAEGTQSHRDLLRATSGETGFLLISDIRRREQGEDAPTNSDVNLDNELQFDVCRKMNPKAAHLKFRLPYLDPEADPPAPDIEVRIPNGVIYFQPWVGPKSTETRLIIEPPYTESNTEVMSSKWYESALFYHNMNTRYSSFVVEGLEALDIFLGTIYDTCFDCTFERYTLLQYLNSGHAPEEYRTFAALYSLLKRVIGREDDRLLK